MNPKQELLGLINDCLRDPGNYVKRLGSGKPQNMEPLRDWQTRAIATLFPVVDSREVDGKVTIVCRTEFRDK